MITVPVAQTLFAKATFTAGIRLGLYRDLMSAMARGMTAGQALEALEAESGPRARAIRDWRLALAAGAPLSRAVRGWVPESDRTVIAASESEGDVLSGIRNAEFLGRGQRHILDAVANQVLPPATAALAVGTLLLLLLAR